MGTTEAHPVAMRHAQSVVRTEVVMDSIAYWIAIVGVYFIQGALWWFSAYEKLFAAGGIAAPAGIAKQFGGTWLASVFGMNFVWGAIGVFEAVIFLVLLASLASGEFLPTRQKSLLQIALSLSLVLFGVFLYGNTMTGQFASVASDYVYFTGTAIVMGLVYLLPPNRPKRWLTSAYFRETLERETGERM
jgi:hypothetical protein